MGRRKRPGTGFSPSRANGVADAAAYDSVSLKEAYRLSKRTTLCCLQSRQRANGQTLSVVGAEGIVNAAPAGGRSREHPA